MDRVVAINRALNEAAKNKDGTRKTSLPVSVVRLTMGQALRDLSRAYVGASDVQVRALDSARLPLEAKLRETPQSGDVPIVEFERIRVLVNRAYTESFGVLGPRANAASLGQELIDSLSRLPDTLGTAVGAAAGFVGDTAGSIVGGLLAGLWPLLLAAIVTLVVKGKLKI